MQTRLSPHACSRRALAGAVLMLSAASTQPLPAQRRPTPPPPRGSEREVLNPPGLAPLVPAYSVAIRDGEWVFVSGMTGIKPGTQDIIDGGIAAQTRQTMENIRTALASGGATMADVAECTVFLKDIAHYDAMNAEYIKFFPVNPPARATLAVTAMPRPAALVEVKCTARRRPDAPPTAPPPPPTSSTAVGIPTGARRFDRALALEDSSVTSASASVGDVNRDGHLDIIDMQPFPVR